MTITEVFNQAKNNMSICKMCKECNGEVCKGQVPGPGGKGSGSTFIRNVKQLKEITLNMEVIHDDHGVDTTFKFFNETLAAPILAAPIANVKINYGSSVDEETYLRSLILGLKQANLLGFVGDGPQAEAFDVPIQIVKENNGQGIPTIKPWQIDTFLEKLKRAVAINPTAIATDVDAAGLVALKKASTPVTFKNGEELKAIKEAIGNTPLIIKGVMTVKDALMAIEAKADAIVESNHGGRVLDDGKSSIEVLEAIATAVDKRCLVLVDGGFRSGTDVFKALALGADAVLIGRPFSHAAIGGLDEGVKLLSEKLISELQDCMVMTNCRSLADIRRSCVNSPF